MSERQAKRRERMAILKREITLGQSIAIAITLIAGIVGTYTHTQVRISLLEQEMNTMQLEFKAYREDQRVIKETLIRMEANQNMILKSQERTQQKFDEYDRNITTFYKDNPGIK